MSYFYELFKLFYRWQRPIYAINLSSKTDDSSELVMTIRFVIYCFVVDNFYQSYRYISNVSICIALLYYKIKRHHYNHNQREKVNRSGILWVKASEGTAMPFETTRHHNMAWTQSPSMCLYCSLTSISLQHIIVNLLNYFGCIIAWGIRKLPS